MSVFVSWATVEKGIWGFHATVAWLFWCWHTPHQTFKLASFWTLCPQPKGMRAKNEVIMSLISSVKALQVIMVPGHSPLKNYIFSHFDFSSFFYFGVCLSVLTPLERQFQESWTTDYLPCTYWLLLLSLIRKLPNNNLKEHYSTEHAGQCAQRSQGKNWVAQSVKIECLKKKGYFSATYWSSHPAVVEKCQASDVQVIWVWVPGLKLVWSSDHWCFPPGGFPFRWWCHVCQDLSFIISSSFNILNPSWTPRFFKY